MSRNPDGTLKKGHNLISPGRPATPPEIRKARRLTACEFIEALNNYVSLPYDKIVELSNQTHLPAVDHIMISLIRYAAVGRSTKHVELLLDRLIGPVKKDEQATQPRNVTNPYSDFSVEDRTKFLDAIKDSDD